MKKDLIHGELTYRVVGCAMNVHNELGYGFLEKVYENALLIELRDAGISTQRQKPIKVEYKSELVGEYLADVVVDEKIIVELKSGKAITDEHVAQTLNYLKATRFNLGLIINFSPNQLEHKRLVY